MFSLKVMMMLASESTSIILKPLEPADLNAYKSLRDESLRRYPDAFQSDYETERLREPESYLGRLGRGEPLGGTFLIGAWDGNKLIGNIGCERSTVMKTRHRAEVFGLVVHQDYCGQGIGTQLVKSCVELAKKASGLQILTATVTASSENVVRLYTSAGFQQYGFLKNALRINSPMGEKYFDKAEMVLML